MQVGMGDEFRMMKWIHRGGTIFNVRRINKWQEVDELNFLLVLYAIKQQNVCADIQWITGKIFILQRSGRLLNKFIRLVQYFRIICSPFFLDSLKKWQHQYIKLLD